MIIAIDGPSGTGKTTLAKRLAAELGIFYLDTGATYRALTLKALQDNIPLTDENALCNLAENLPLQLQEGKVYLGKKDVTLTIRSPEIDQNISRPVSFPSVRAAMVRLQRNLVKEKDAVVEGRDITTVVFPEAALKVYLDADISIRAKRRYDELQRRGVCISFDEVLAQMNKRDHADLHRKVGPLTKSSDAQYVDTSRLSQEEVLQILLEKVKIIGKTAFFNHSQEK